VTRRLRDIRVASAWIPGGVRLDFHRLSQAPEFGHERVVHYHQSIAAVPLPITSVPLAFKIRPESTRTFISNRELRFERGNARQKLFEARPAGILLDATRLPGGLPMHNLGQVDQNYYRLAVVGGRPWQVMPADQATRGLRVDAKSFGNLSVGSVAMFVRLDSGRMMQRIG
jgi:hypothetical protein